MHILKNILKKFLLSRNCVISRPPGQFSVDAFKYLRLRQRGVHIKSAIDGGAASGGWAKMFRGVFPEAEILCVEPRKDVFKTLDQWALSVNGITTANNLLGAKESQVDFNESYDQSSVLNLDGNKEFGKKVSARMTTLDQLIVEKSFPQPELIKLDLQGYELQALMGATQCVQSCFFVEVELSLFPFQESQPIFAEAVSFMDSIGFRLYDILGLWQRPLDGALGQGDFLFVSKRSAVISSSAWG